MINRCLTWKRTLAIIVWRFGVRNFLTHCVQSEADRHTNSSTSAALPRCPFEIRFFSPTVAFCARMFVTPYPSLRLTIGTVTFTISVSRWPLSVAKIVVIVQRVITDESKKVWPFFQLGKVSKTAAIGCQKESFKPWFSHWIPIDPSLQIRIVKPMAVIIHAAVDVDFFARKAINVGAGEGAAGGNDVAERIIAVTGNHGQVVIEHVSDIAVAVGEVIIVCREIAARVA